MQADGPFTRPHTFTFVNAASINRLRTHQRGEQVVLMLSAPPTIPYRLQPSGPMGNTTLIDLIKKVQGVELRILTKPHLPGGPQTLMQRLEQYEAKGKEPEHGPSSFAPSPMPKRLGSLPSSTDVVKYENSTQIPCELSSSLQVVDVSLDQPGPSKSRSMSYQSTSIRDEQSSYAQNYLQQRRSANVQMGEKLLMPLPFSTLPERDSESMADRRRRLLEMKQSLNRTHEPRSPLTPTVRILSPGSVIERGSASDGPLGSSSSSINKSPEAEHQFTSRGTKLENKTLPPSGSSGSSAGSSCYKTQQEERASTQSGHSTSSGSDLGLDASPYISGQSGLTPASSVDTMVESRALKEYAQRVPGFELVTTWCQAECLPLAEEVELSTREGKQAALATKEAVDRLEGGDMRVTETSATGSKRATTSYDAVDEERLLPETESGDVFDSSQILPSRDDPEVQSRCESVGEGNESETQPSRSWGEDDPSDEEVDKGLQLVSQRDATRTARSFSFSSAETVTRVSSRRPRGTDENRRSLQLAIEGSLAADSLGSSTGTMTRAASSHGPSRDGDEHTAQRRDSALDYSEPPICADTPGDADKTEDIGH